MTETNKKGANKVIGEVIQAPEAETRSFVDKADFDKFKSEQAKIQEKILELLTTRIEVTPTKEEKIVDEGKPQDIFNGEYLPPQYKQIFEKYFDPEDGFTAKLSFPDIDEKGIESGGITFTIFVPLKLSNTDDGYRKMFKQDLRTRALQPNNIAKGIEAYCKLVAKNLHYNRSLARK